jgi:4-hydroxy-2-oxoheptanedioate aldolase
MRGKAFREALLAGETLLGVYISLPCANLVEMAAYAGFDFIRIDHEHGAINDETLADLIRAADMGGLPAFVRVRKNDEINILRSLDLGASGVMIPHVNNRGEAERAVRYARYGDLGRRSVYHKGRTARFGDVPPLEYLKRANEETLVIVQIESAQGLMNCQEIMSTPGIDMVATGRADLSQALGVLGRTDHPLVDEAEERVILAAKEAGVLISLSPGSPEKARELYARGIRCMMLGNDAPLIFQAFKRVLVDAREALNLSTLDES